MSEECLDTWFKREVLSQEEILMRYLLRTWPSRDEVPDICQEAYARVYESALISRPQSGRAFLFATARHLMADRVRRERIVSIQAAGDTEFLNVLVDEISPERRVSSTQELTRLARAFDRLPARCRDVVWLRRVNDLSQREAAELLGLSEKTVEKYMATGSRLLAQYMRSNTLSARMPRNESSEQTEDEAENGHGSQQGD